MAESTDELLRRVQRRSDGGVFYPGDIPADIKPAALTRRLRRAGLAMPCGDGFWVLTRKGGNEHYQGPEPTT